jgi:hypothetical protein
MPRGDAGQTIGIYIVAMSALFFLAFAYFAVGQAAVTRNGAQTAADSAALAVARSYRDEAYDPFLAALLAGDKVELLRLLVDPGNGIDSPCPAAGAYAADNHATVTGCGPDGGSTSYAVSVRTTGSVGNSVVKGSENVHGTASATAIVEPRCTVTGGVGPVIFACQDGPLTVDPTTPGFVLDLSVFYTVHLSS